MIGFNETNICWSKIDYKIDFGTGREDGSSLATLIVQTIQWNLESQRYTSRMM